MRILLTLFLLLFSQLAGATDYYVRDCSGTNGDGSVASCGNPTGAWDGDANVTWGSLGAGDTLYVVGNLGEALTVEASGTAVNDLTIRGDDAAGAGQVDDIILDDNDGSYLTIRNIQVNGVIRGASGPIETWTCSFTAPDTITCSGETFGGSFPADTGVWVSDAGANNNRYYYIESVSGDTGTIKDDTGYVAVLDESSNSVRLEGFAIQTNVTIEEVNIQSDGYVAFPSGGELIGTIGIRNNLTIKNCELDGNENDHNGAIYPSFGSFKAAEDILFQGNYVHAIGNDVNQTYDNHCVGVQWVDGLTITKNHFEDCAAGIVFYTSSAKPIKDWQITYNYFDGMDDSNHPTQFPGCGIVFSFSDSDSGSDAGTVAYNVLGPPLNCTPGESSHCEGIRTKWTNQINVFNNTIDGYDDGVVVVSGGGINFKNNIVVNSVDDHISSPGGGNYSAWTEDYNIYNPDGAGKFTWDGDVNYSGYNSAASDDGETINANSSTSDPLLNSNYILDSSSPAINSGDSVSVSDGLDPNTVWPTGSGQDTVNTWGQMGVFDIGAFVDVPGVRGVSFQ